MRGIPIFCLLAPTAALVATFDAPLQMYTGPHSSRQLQVALPTAWLVNVLNTDVSGQWWSYMSRNGLR